MLAVDDPKSNIIHFEVNWGEKSSVLGLELHFYSLLLNVLWKLLSVIFSPPLQIMDYSAVFRDNLLGFCSLQVNTLPPNQKKVGKRLELLWGIFFPLHHLFYDSFWFQLQKLTLELLSKKFTKRGTIGVLELEVVFRTFHERLDPVDPPSSPPGPHMERRLSLSTRDGSGLLEVFIKKGINLEPYRDGNICCYCKVSIDKDVQVTRVTFATA